MGSETQISDAESLVMEALWTRNPLTAEGVVAALALQQTWTDATIKSLLNRLLKKGAIKAEADGRRYLYSPVLQRADWVHCQSAGLLSRLFGGRVAPLVAHFSERGELSRKDVEELKRLIKELDK